tara:strand:+ start:1573 stop:2013 length:441 start_codon:yes stop_codon:yes gene_type:complete
MTIYAIVIDNTIQKTGSIKSLFPNTSFPLNGVPASFLTENNVVDLITSLDYTKPTQKLTEVDPYIEGGKAYNVKIESTTTEEQTTLIAGRWSNVRMERDALLQQSDWRASSDLNLSDDWKTYRQALRDVPAQSDPFNIIWPTAPSS